MQGAWLPPAEGFVKEPQMCHWGWAGPRCAGAENGAPLLGQWVPRECWEAAERARPPRHAPRASVLFLLLFSTMRAVLWEDGFEQNNSGDNT